MQAVAVSGSEIRDPEKSYSGSGSRGQKDPGSGSATLLVRFDPDPDKDFLCQVKNYLQFENLYAQTGSSNMKFLNFFLFCGGTI